MSSWLLNVFSRGKKKAESTVSGGEVDGGAAGRDKLLHFHPKDTERDIGSQGTRGHYAYPVVFYLFTLYRR